MCLLSCHEVVTSQDSCVLCQRYVLMAMLHSHHWCCTQQALTLAAMATACCCLCGMTGDTLQHGCSEWVPCCVHLSVAWLWDMPAHLVVMIATTWIAITGILTVEGQCAHSMPVSLFVIY